MTPPRFSRREMLLSPAAALAACSRPRATTFYGYCFVANQQSRTVAVVDLRRFRVRKEIPLDAAPSLVIPHPTAAKVYVLAPDAGTVFELETGSLSVTRRAGAGNQALAMQVSPRRDALWVLYRDPASLVELPFDTLKPRRRVHLPSPPDTFDLTTSHSEIRRAAVASSRDRNIAIVSLDNARIEQSVASPQEPSLVQFRRDGKSLIAGSRPERCLNIFDVPSGKTVVRLPLGIEPRHFCITPDGGQLFMSGDGMDAVVILFPYSTEIWQTILAGRAPGAMAIANSPPQLLVSNPETDSVTVLDVATQKLVAVIEVGKQPGQIVFTPDAQQYALVLNEGSGDLAVVRTYSLRAPQLSAKARFKSAPVFTMIPVGEKPVSAAVVALG